MRDILHWLLLAFLLGLFLGTLRESHGQERGLDLLGLQQRNFPTAAFADGIPEHFVGGNLDWTFGSTLAPIRLLLETGNVAAWRTHFFNGPCLRAGNCGRYEPHAGRSVRSFSDAWERGGGGKLRRHLASRVRAYCALFEHYPAVELFLSPTLEHNLTRKAFRRQAALVRRYCPNAVVVDNPAGGVAHTSGFVTERHGRRVPLRPACIVSLDGELGGVSLARFFADHSQCLALAWTLALNCRAVSGPFVDPRKRTACPTPEQVRHLLSVL